MIAKRYIVFIFLFFAIISLNAQNIKNKQFALFNYNLDISKDVTDELSELEPFIKKIKTYNDPGNDKFRAILVHIIYYTIQEKLKEQLEIEILPINTFMRTVKYDDYGYPETTVRDAIRKGDSRFYFKVDVYIESLTKKKKEDNPEMFADIDYPTIFPQIKIEITVNNNEGIIPVDKWVGISESKYPLPINEYLLKGFDNTMMTIEPAENQQQDNFYLMLDRAIHNAIQDFYTK